MSTVPLSVVKPQLSHASRVLAIGHDVNAALEAYRRAAEYEPEDVGTHFLIGDLYKLAGDLAAARDSFETAETLVRPRASGDPDNTEAQRDLGVSHNRIGDVLVTRGDGPAALEWQAIA